MDWEKTIAWWDEKHSSFGIDVPYIKDLMVSDIGFIMVHGLNEGHIKHKPFPSYIINLKSKHKPIWSY